MEWFDWMFAVFEKCMEIGFTQGARQALDLIDQRIAELDEKFGGTALLIEDWRHQ